MSINNAGTIVGTSGNEDRSATHAVIWKNGAIQELHDPPGVTPVRVETIAINDSGAIVAHWDVHTSVPLEITPSYLYRGASIATLPPVLAAPQPVTYAYDWSEAINNSGIVAGESYTMRYATLQIHATIWRGGVPSVLDSGQGFTASYAEGINDHGAVVGTASSSPNLTGPYHATLWRNGTMTDLGVLPGLVESAARAINNSGEIVGVSSGGHTQTGFLYAHGSMTPLKPVYAVGLSDAVDINASGQIVGFSDGPGGHPGLRATLWENGQPVDLNTRLLDGSGWFLYKASAINDSGQIVGVGSFHGQTRAFLLNPQFPVASPVTTARLTGSFGNQSWYVSPVTISLSASDPAFPARTLKTFAKLDNGAWQAYASPIVITANGPHTIVYYSVDPADKAEKSRTQSFKVDTVAPQVQVAARPAILAPANGRWVSITIAGTVSDGGSGLGAKASATYTTTDSLETIHPKGAIAIHSNGAYRARIPLRALRNPSDPAGRTYTITIVAQDVAGNKTSRSVAVVVPPRGVSPNSLPAQRNRQFRVHFGSWPTHFLRSEGP